MWWTSVFLQPLPWQFLMPKPSWQQILSTGSLLPPCLHPAGPSAAIPEAVFSSGKLWWLRQEIPLNQRSSAIMEMSLSIFYSWSCASIRVYLKRRNVCPNHHLLLLFEKVSQECCPVWCLPCVRSASGMDALQEFKPCWYLKGQEDVQSTMGTLQRLSWAQKMQNLYLEPQNSWGWKGP